MLRRFAVFTLGLILSAGTWLLQQTPRFQDITWLPDVFHTLVAFTAIYGLFKIVFLQWVGQRLHHEKTRYMFRKAVSVLYMAVFLVVGIRIWVTDPANLLVAYGLIGAGVAVALQDFFKNFVGGLTLFTTDRYSIGDRVELQDVYGDVIDVGLMYTTILEIQEWVNGDQPTGRLITVPNGSILGDVFHNYTQNNSFLWDEITLTLTYESNWEKAMNQLENIAEEETVDIQKTADKELSAIKRKYYVEERDVTPQVFMQVTDNWVELHLRYVTDARNRRDTQHRISQRILETVEAADDLEIGSETSDVTIRDRS